MTVPPAAPAPSAAADLGQCATEPIERPGTVQPHGVMIVTDPAASTVLAASASAARLLPGVPATPGTPLSVTLGETLAAEVAELLADGDLAEPIRWDGPAAGPWAGRAVDVLLHRSAGRIVVELEALTDSSLGRAVSLSSTRSAIRRLERGDTSAEVFGRLVREVRGVTGFDRVMVYRFDREWNGEVIAEERAAGLEPFLGLHYPASDIPAQARRLYVLNRLRFIVDAHAVASALQPAAPDDGAGELDMSFAVLRSVSPVHLEYLRGMGVRASMSVSMVRDGQLWGLVACHHYAGTLQPSHDERAAADLLVQAALQAVTERDARHDAARLAEGRAQVARLAGRLEPPDGSPVAGLAAGDLGELAALAAATGLMVRAGGETVRWGSTVDDRRAAAIVDALRVNGRSEGVPVFTDHLDAIDGGLGGPEAAGALVLGLGDDWVLWLGEAVERTVDWAGDPDDKTVTTRADGTARIGPRTSFAAARRILRGRSRPWDSWKVQAVAELGATAAAVVRGREREALAVADDLRATLSPGALPSVPELELDVRYVPAAGGRFAGDWWDAFELPGRRIALAVGDVAGHGGGAAVVMSQLRTALRAYLFEGLVPAETLARLDGLAHVLFPSRLATVVLAVADLGSGELQLARAGHPHPILVPGDGGPAGPVPVDPRPPIGIGLTTAVVPWTGALAPGDVLVLHSDGLVERRDLTLAEGAAQLAAGAAATRTGPLGTLTERLMTAVPGSGDDDRTVVAARRRPA